MTRRIELDATSWIEHVTGWLPGPDADELLGKLIAGAEWEQRDRWMVNRRVLEPRLTAEYNDLTNAPHPALRAAATRLTSEYGVSYDGLWINFYRDHRDSTGWHGDWPTCKRPVCTVPVLSLGAPRRFLIKPRSGGRSIGFTPRSGDLIVMGGRCQRDWLHSVRRCRRLGEPRINSDKWDDQIRKVQVPIYDVAFSRTWRLRHVREKAFGVAACLGVAAMTVSRSCLPGVRTALTGFACGRRQVRSCWRTSTLGDEHCSAAVPTDRR